MSVRRVIRALALHDWPDGKVTTGDDHYWIGATPEHAVRCLRCDEDALQVALGAGRYEIVLRCDSQDRR